MLLSMNRVYIALAALVLACTTSHAIAIPAPTMVVNSTADSTLNDGLCTLREAILSTISKAPSGNMPGECAAGSATLSLIGFNIPGTDAGCVGTPKLCTIKPATALPFMTQRVFIDGYSQPGSSQNTQAVGDNAVILIELDGSNSNPSLQLEGAGSSSSTIRGLAISHLAPIGIIIHSSSTNDAIIGNFIGTNAAGTVSSGAGNAMTVDSCDGAIIGGTVPSVRNVLGGAGASVFLADSSNAVIQGNYVGVDRTGSAILSPPQQGIQINGASNNTLIGGATAGAGNVIGSWVAHGIFLGGTGSNNRVQGNKIGTDATGTVRLGGGGAHAVGYIGAGTGNKIGGDAPGEGNLIAGASSNGILLGGSSTDLLVQGNLIGPDVSGALPLGNGTDGIMVFSGGGVIGGATPGAANRIAFNGANGVDIPNGATGLAINGNAIYANGALGISLTGSGIPTPNDPGDADSGSNQLQNYPVIGAVTVSPNTTVHVSGSLNSATSTIFRLEFFANANCDDAGNGEGKIFIGFANVTTSPNDVAFGPLTFAVPADRHVITATATDPNGNTSEFSACGTQDTIFSDGLEGN